MTFTGFANIQTKLKFGEVGFLQPKPCLNFELPQDHMEPQVINPQRNK